MSDVFCAVPFVGVSTTTDGHVRLCCQAKKSKLHVTDTPLSDIWNSDYYSRARESFINNNWPDACIVCKDLEERNIKSRREFENSKWPHLTKQSITSNPVIREFDLRLGNTCNLKCIMCTPASSSLWVGEHENHDHIKNFNLSDNHQWAINSGLPDDILQHLPNLERLHFSGGEPLLIKAHHNLLDHCIEQNIAANIQLSYDTNGTQINQQIIEKWKNFRSVTVNLSIDGGKETVEYIRYPIKYESITNALSLMQHINTIDVVIRMSVGAYNILDYPIVDSLCKQYKCKDINISIVRWPDFLSLNVLSDHKKLYLKEYVINNKDIIHARITGMINDLKINNSNTDRMVNYFNKLDEHRGTNYKQVFTWI